MKRGASGLCGVLAVDKPQGVTSHDVVNVIRRLTGEKRVGHAGTLDPMATGLMLVCVGAATRLSAYLTGHDKSYIARIVFGAATDTDDAEGRVISSQPDADLSERLASCGVSSEQELLDSILGCSMQLPPAYSAIKKNGVTAYKAAREGKQLELEPREIVIDKARLVGCGKEHVRLSDGADGFFEDDLAYWDVELAVSKGTYIRSIARDLGYRLGCGAHLSALRRTSVASCKIDDAYTLEALAQIAADGQELPWADPVALLGFDDVCELSQEDMNDVSCGRKLDLKGDMPAGPVCCVYKGKLMAVYAAQDGALKPEVVIPGGVSGVSASNTQSHSARLISWDLKETPSFTLGRRVVAIGVFDGLHDGHKSLFAAARQDAQERGCCLTILTFDIDPDELFGREPASFKLMSNKSRLAALASEQSAGADEVVAIVTDKTNLSLEPAAFLDRLASQIDVASVHVGADFRFGKKAAGTVADIQTWCKAIDADCYPQKLYKAKGEIVTATRARKLIAQGNVDAASELGATHEVCGTVERGRGEGTGMGFATANVAPDGLTMLPAEGVYGGFAEVDGLWYAAAINVGAAASFEKATSPIEAHMIGYEGVMYDKTIELRFAHWIRLQIKFEDLQELIATVTSNIDWVRDNLVPQAEEMNKGR